MSFIRWGGLYNKMELLAINVELSKLLEKLSAGD